MGQHEFLSVNKVIHFPWRFQFNFYFKISKGILALKRHTRGNFDTEFLQSLEDPEKLFKKKDKEKIDISMFGASSSQYFHSILDQEWEINAENGLLKSKS